MKSAVAVFVAVLFGITSTVRTQSLVEAAAEAAKIRAAAEGRDWHPIYLGSAPVDHPGDAATLGRNLRAVVPALGDGQPRKDTGERVRIYSGIRLK